MVDNYQEKRQLLQNNSDIVVLLRKQAKKMDLHLAISIGLLIIILFFYFFFLEALNLFYYKILLTILFISFLFAILPRLKAIELSLLSRKNINSSIVLKRKEYAGLLVITSFIVLLITAFIISLIIIAILLFFFLNEVKIVYNEGTFHKVFQKSPIVLLSAMAILGAVAFIQKRISDVFPYLIEISLTFVFTVFLLAVFSEVKLPEKVIDEGDILREKVKEIFDEKRCEVHPTQTPNMSCSNCDREICEFCISSYMKLCVHCYKKNLEDRLLFFNFLKYLSVALFNIFLISFIWGMYAPLPLILRFIDWLGLQYGRFIILFYYAAANFIILISLGGGGIFASRQLKIKINQLESIVTKKVDSKFN